MIRGEIIFALFAKVYHYVHEGVLCYFFGFLFPFQGFIVTSPQLTNPGLIASLGSHYPTGTSFAIVPSK